MKTRLVAFVLVLSTLLLVGGASWANTITKKDGNDAKGPLDLAGMKITHKSGAHVFQVSTQAAFTNAEANGDHGFFQVAIDTNADKKGNYFIDLFYASGRFRGVLFKPSGAVITYKLSASRVSSRAVKVALPLSKIAEKGSYDVGVFSIYRDAPCNKKHPCVDAIPNQYPLIRHDFTPPSGAWTSVPLYPSDVSDTLSFPVAFKLKDDVYGSGVKGWTLQSRLVGSGVWVTQSTGAASTTSGNVTGEQGGRYDVRLVVLDRQGNRSTVAYPNGPSSIPWDDQNGVLARTGTWTDASSVTGAFLGTTSTGAMNASMSFTLSADPYHNFCVLGGPTASGDATLDVTFGSFSPITLTEHTTTTARERLCFSGGVDGPVTLQVTSAEPFVIDGVVVGRYPF